MGNCLFHLGSYGSAPTGFLEILGLLGLEAMLGFGLVALIGEGPMADELLRWR